MQKIDFRRTAFTTDLIAFLAFKSPLLQMNSAMVAVQIASLRKRLTALIALERFFARVHPIVTLQLDG